MRHKKRNFTLFPFASSFSEPFDQVSSELCAATMLPDLLSSPECTRKTHAFKDWSSYVAEDRFIASSMKKITLRRTKDDVTIFQSLSSRMNILTGAMIWLTFVRELKLGDSAQQNRLKPSFWARAIKNPYTNTCFHWNRWWLQSGFSRCDVLLSD